MWRIIQTFTTLNQSKLIYGYNKNIAALFDFDGVVMDTETQYSVFWDELGRRYHPEIKDFGCVIKGQTLTQIYDKYFAGMDNIQKKSRLT